MHRDHNAQRPQCTETTMHRDHNAQRPQCTETTMHRNLVPFALLVLLTACGSDSNPPTPVCTAGTSTGCTCSDDRSGAQVCNTAGSGYDSCEYVELPDAGPPTDASCPSENGAVACNRVIGTFCARIIMCCDASATPCPDWTIDDPSCRAYFVSEGFDCSSPEVTSTTDCTADVDRCIADMPLVACSDIVGGTANLPASCAAL